MSISIKCNFSLPTDSSNSSPNDQRVISKSFDASNCKESRIGLPEGTEATKPKNGDYTYSGMHDAGPLFPKPRESGPYALLLACSRQANAHSDQILTEIIENERKNDKGKRCGHPS